jgi:hypothetical protein
VSVRAAHRPTSAAASTLHAPQGSELRKYHEVELSGLGPLTSCMPVRRQHVHLRLLVQVTVLTYRPGSAPVAVLSCCLLYDHLLIFAPRRHQRGHQLLSNHPACPKLSQLLPEPPRGYPVAVSGPDIPTRAADLPISASAPAIVDQGTVRKSQVIASAAAANAARWWSYPGRLAGRVPARYLNRLP